MICLLAGMALFGSATPVSKLVGQDFPVFTASLARVALGAVVLAPIAFLQWRRARPGLVRRDWIYLSLIALFGMAGFTLLLISGMKLISGVAGSIIMSFTPALTAVAAMAFLGSPLGWRKGAAIALGVTGLIVLNAFRGAFGDDSGGGAFLLGAALVLGAICCEAAYTLLGKRATRDVPPILATFLACIISLPLFAALSAIDIGSLDMAAAPAGAWVALAWWGAGTLGAGSALWYTGVSRAEGTTAAGFMAVMPASALILSYVLLGEEFRVVHLAGIAAVAASIGLMSWAHMREMKAEAEKG